jgi:hypothetical protein
MEYINKGNTSLEDQILKATIERCKDVGVDPFAVLLHGSRVNGNSYEGSDWDLYVLSDPEQEATGALSRVLEGNFLDISRIPYLPDQDSGKYSEDRFSPAMQFKLLWAADEKYKGFADRAVASSAKRYASRQDTNDERKQFLLEIIFDRFTARIVTCPEPLRRLVYLSNFIDRVARHDYFYFTNQWSRSISEGAEIIKEKDPELYKLLVELPSAQEDRVGTVMDEIKNYFEKIARENPGTTEN